jgi:hypothetical protein
MPVFIGIFALWRAGREYLARCDWRRERVSKPGYGLVGDGLFLLA